MKGLLLIPGSKSTKNSPYGEGPEDDDEEENEEDGEDAKNSDADFKSLFSSFASALGVSPENEEKAAKRLKSLIQMCMSKYI